MSLPKKGPLAMWMLPMILVGGCGGEVVEPGLTIDSESIGAQKVTLRTIVNGDFVVAENGGGSIVNANRTQAQQWETLSMFDLNGGVLADGDFIALAASNGQFLSAEGGGGGIVNANRTAIRDWELFQVIRMGGPGEVADNGQIALKTKTSGLFVSADQGGGGGLTADRSAIQAWELFTIDLPSGAAPPNQPPPPPGDPGSPTLPTRLRVTSRCAAPIWIAHSDNVPDGQNIMLSNGQSHDYNIPAGGLSAARFWPKVGCDGSGHSCTMGDNGEGGGRPCPSTGCQPPLDSKFEVSFSAQGGAESTFYNLSQVDGYTLPFKVVPKGKGAEGGSCVTSDCGKLLLDGCPGDEDMSGGGAFSSFAHEDLRVRDAGGKTIACMAPCKKWNYPAPYGHGQSESADPGLHLCCPTPIDPASGQCTAANGCISPDQCRATSDPRSVEHTDYVAAIRKMCPSAYSYSYDDDAGLHSCPSTVGFEVTFCP
jgi:hypothetical protein